jgi:hypothetical protein
LSWLPPIPPSAVKKCRHVTLGIGPISFALSFYNCATLRVSLILDNLEHFQEELAKKGYQVRKSVFDEAG